MEFLTAFHADRGLVKERNQDSLCVKVAKTGVGNIAMAVVCDGMGGFSKGELASSTVVKSFSEWFDEELPALIQSEVTPELIRERWNYLIHNQNNRILEYGRVNNIKLGTTLVAILIFDNKFVVTVNVGDSRIYKVNNGIYRMTEDQTVVQMDLLCGKITREQAETDPRRHILLQCVGGSPDLKPVFTCSSADKDTMYVLCSDGLSNRIEDQELFSYFNPVYNYNEQIMQQRAIDMVEMSKSRQETDNISVMLIRTF